MSTSPRHIASVATLVWSTLVASNVALAQQKTIPIRTVEAPILSKEHFVVRPDVRALPGGRLLVNDQRGKRLLVFDSTMSTFTVSADSAGVGNRLYPGMGLQMFLIPFAGDSTLLLDFAARAFVLIDPNGIPNHALAHPKASDLLNVAQPYSANTSGDNKERLIYRASGDGRPQLKPGDPPITATRDTIGIVRVDFNTRAVDTLGSFTIPRSAETVFTDGPGGKKLGARVINPLPAGPDEFAVMSDGTVAVVREHDYHIDWITPEGAKSSSPKLPFDWRRLTDQDKLARIDSMKRVIDSVNATGRPYGWTLRMTRLPEGGTRADTIIPTVSFVPIGEISDYAPPIRQGSVKPDAENNLWILPNTSAAGGVGIVYDVVNRKGELFERVRIPPDYVIVGHGRGNVVYLAKNDKTDNTWVIARTRIVPAVIK